MPYLKEMTTCSKLSPSTVILLTRCKIKLHWNFFLLCNVAFTCCLLLWRTAFICLSRNILLNHSIVESFHDHHELVTNWIWQLSTSVSHSSRCTGFGPLWIHMLWSWLNWMIFQSLNSVRHWFRTVLVTLKWFWVSRRWMW